MIKSDSCLFLEENHSTFLPWWAVKAGLLYVTLVFPSRFSGSLQHQQAPRGITLGEKSLMALCPTSCGVLVTCDSLFGLIHSKWATKNWLRKVRSLMITLSWCGCPSGRSIVVSLLSDQLIHKLNCSPKGSTMECREDEASALSFHCSGAKRGLVAAKTMTSPRCCTKNCFQTT